MERSEASAVPAWRIGARTTRRLFALAILVAVPILVAAVLPSDLRMCHRSANELAAREPQPGEIVLHTLNVFGLPWPAGVDVTRRCAATADWLRTELPHVVALQEVWDEVARQPLLIEGYHASWWESDRGLLDQGGLLTLTRWPIVATSARTFSSSSGIEAMVAKGALRTRVQIDRETQWDVWNVHLQSGIDAGLVRGGQILELVEWVAAESGAQPIVMGDFNCGPGCAEWDALVAAFAAIGLEPRACPEPTYDAVSNPLATPEPPSAIDHVFVGRQLAGAMSPAQRRHDRPRDGVFLSDHYGVEVRWRGRVPGVSR